LGATHAVILILKSAKPWKTSRFGANVSNDILRTTCELGWEIWKKWNGYHRRSFVEDKMCYFKLLGERVMVRDFNRQVVEL